MSTPLTTIRQPAYEVGKKASDKLIALIEDSDEEIQEIVVPTELVVRESCGCSALEEQNVMTGQMELAD
jgi:DNA-binding LacI/PurR family transcriptional regulator